MGDPVTMSILGGATAAGIGGSSGKKGGSGPTAGQQLQEKFQGLTTMQQLPQLWTQQAHGLQFQSGERALEDTYMGKTLIGPENLAYKAAQDRAREMIPEGGQLNQAMGQIEQGRAYQDAQARQQATASLLGPAPLLGGFAQTSGLASGTGGQIAGADAQRAGVQGSILGGAGQLLGLSLMAGKGN